MNARRRAMPVTVPAPATSCGCGCSGKKPSCSAASEPASVGFTYVEPESGYSWLWWLVAAGAGYVGYRAWNNSAPAGEGWSRATKRKYYSGAAGKKRAAAQRKRDADSAALKRALGIV